MTFISFLLVLVRLTSYVAIMPVLSMRQIPSTVKIALTVLIAFFITPIIQVKPLELTSLLELAMLALQEALLGATLAFTSLVIYLGIQGAGDLIDFTAGLKMAATYDPLTGVSSSLYMSLYNWIATLLFFFMDGHHFLLKGITNSFFVFELGTEYLQSITLESVIYIITQSFFISIQLAVPIAIILFLIDIILGMISKVIPNMNVFLLGMPLKILISLFMHIIIIGGVIKAMVWALEFVVTILDYFIKSLV